MKTLRSVVTCAGTAALCAAFAVVLAAQSRPSETSPARPQAQQQRDQERDRLTAG